MSVTFEPPNRRVSMTVLAQSDDIQEQVENVTLMFTIGDSCLESVVAGNPSEATVTITDTTESKCPLPSHHTYIRMYPWYTAIGTY